MRPGVSRSLIGALLGFAVGALIVTGLRIAFNFTPYWNLGLVLVMGTFTLVYGALWGIGAFNPRMSEHPDDSVPEPTIDELAEQSGWIGMLSNTTWQVWAAALLVTFGFIALAFIPGVGLTITRVADGSPRLFGSVELELFGAMFPVSQAWLLIAFTAFTMLSLAVTAALLSGAFYGLSDQVTKVEAQPEQDPQKRIDNPNRVLKGAGGIAGRLAEAIAPKEDRETTAVVARKDN